MKIRIKSAENIKPTVVYVRFDGGKEYSYLNDRFELAVGDRVYVEGKLAGKIGEVTEVLKQFMVSLKYYKYVIEKIDYSLEGKFGCVEDFYVSDTGRALDYDKAIRWFEAPETEEEEEVFVFGDGYEISLPSLDCPENCGIDEYYSGEQELLYGNVKVISINNGSGYAIVGGGKAKTVSFELCGDVMKNIYCDCICPRLCEDAVAVAIALRNISKKHKINANAFTAIQSDTFLDAVNKSNKEIAF